MGLRNRLRLLLAASAVAVIGALPLASTASAQLSASEGPYRVCAKRCSHPPAKNLHAGEFCKKCAQSFYHRHGYTCKKASDGRLRLFTT
jgi:hypothetical protein